MIWLLSSLIFVASSTTLALVLCEIAGSLSLSIAVVSLLVGLVLSVLSFLKWRKDFLFEKKLNYFDWLMVLFFGVFCFRHFLWLVFQNGDAVMTLDPSNYGDLPHHIAFINLFARGAHFWPQNPLLINESFTYPVGVDLFSSLLTKIGLPFLYHLPMTGFIASFLLAIALLAWGGGFALGAFLFAGGGLNYMPLVFHQLRNYQDGKPWGSIILLFTTQRGFLYALPAGLLLLWSWRRRFFSDDKPLPVFLEGLFWGTMPFFHVHTFLFLSFTYALWFLTTRKFREIRIFFWAFLPAVLEMILVTDHFSKKSIIWFKPGWMINNDNILMFFWSNYGLFVFFTLAALIVAVKKPKAWKQILPGALLYLICLFVMFAPWDWDNIKLMMWCYVLALPIIYELTIKPFSPQLQALIIFAMFLPGFIAVASMHDPQNRGNQIYSRTAYDGTCQALKDAPPEARVATAQVHNHPALLCGHPLVAGYAGVLWSWGYHAEGVQDKLTRLMKGDSEWRQLAKELHARYLFWGPLEVTAYPGSTRPWEASDIKVVARGEWGEIYDLENLLN